MSWCRLVCVSVAKDGCILSKRKLKLIARITLAIAASKSCRCRRLQSDAHRIHLPAQTARSAQNWLRANCPDFLAKDQWPPNSPDLNPVDYHVWGAMLEAYHKLKTKPQTIAELKSALQVIWDNLPQGPIDKAVKDFSKRLKACVEAVCGHFEQSHWQWNSDIWSSVNCVVQTMVLNWCTAWTFFTAGKLVGGHVK